jgi:hypothetical protein
MGPGAAHPAWGRALGVYLAEGHLTLTELATTLSGRRILSACRLPVGEAGPGKTLADWLEAHIPPRRRRKLAVSIGLAAEQTFFTTRTYADTSGEAPTVAGLLSAGGGAALDPAHTTADFARSRFRRTTFYRIAACRRVLAEELYQALASVGVRTVRLEPAPASVLEAIDRTARPPYAWRTLVRVLLSQGGGLAMLVAGGKPVLWRRFAMTAGQEALNVASAVRNIEVHARVNLGLHGLAGLFIQGKGADGLAEELRSYTTLTVRAADGAVLDDATYSLALALAARKKDPDRIDLLRSTRPPPSLARLFPRQLAAGLVAAAAVVGLVLWNARAELQDQCETLGVQNASYAWAEGVKADTLRAERKTLSDEVTAIQRFLGTRVVWSNYLRDLPTRLPANSCLQSLVGDYEMKSVGKTTGRNANRSLTICGQARYTDRGSAPKDIDAFLDSLRAADLLRKTFPQVNLAEIKWKKEFGADIALFTIIATPAEKAAGKEEGEESASPGKGKTPAHG